MTAVASAFAAAGPLVALTILPRFLDPFARSFPEMLGERTSSAFIAALSQLDHLRPCDDTFEEAWQALAGREELLDALDSWDGRPTTSKHVLERLLAVCV
jgi:hypothetical protein